MLGLKDGWTCPPVLLECLVKVGGFVAGITTPLVPKPPFDALTLSHHPRGQIF